jgi:hypothetical protein
MLDHTTYPNVRKTPRDLLLRVLNAVGSKIFRADDRHAREHGWQISPRHGGLSRTYRDPRFDSLTLCGTCNGHGLNSDRTSCRGCGGSGRLVLDRADHTSQSRRQQERGWPP